MIDSLFVAPSKNGTRRFKYSSKNVGHGERWHSLKGLFDGSKKNLRKKFSITFPLLLCVWLQKKDRWQTKVDVSGTAYALGPMHRDARS